MRRYFPALVITMALATSPFACSKVESEKPSGSPGQTQAGSAHDESQGAPAGSAGSSCGDLPSASDLKKWLKEAPGGIHAGGLFDGKMEWAAVVNRNGEVCAAAAATDDPASAWPGSQSIAKAKAYTANAYSNDEKPLSTARMYTLTQPGHSLWSISGSNTFNPACNVSPQNASQTDGKICGGEIAFGGGVALYKGKTKVGGLGLSGDTSCADHEVAKAVRHLAKLDPPGGESADDIVYPSVDGPSEFAHPLCDNTWRNGKKIGDEAKVKGY